MAAANSTRSSFLRRSKVSDSRPMYATILIFSLLALYSFMLRHFVPAAASASASASTSISTSASTSTTFAQLRRSDQFSSSKDCRSVHSAIDQCAFVKRNCRDDEAGLLEYLTFYYCHLGHAQPVAFVVLVLWLGLLFTTIGIAASDFFSINLSTIAAFLGLSESLAGVTFLALGNGSPDVFSTFAAMGSNSGSMAVGELIGAASFITTVVAGSMALVCEFPVARKTFVRDICFFIVAVAFAMGFLSDGQLYMWECSVMIGFYLFYVVVVVGWHAWSKRARARRVKEEAARSHFYRTASDRGNDELEPYRDAPDDDDPTTSVQPPTADIDALERASQRSPAQIQDDDSDRNQHVVAEMTSSMRVNRPRGRRSTSTITPIRPSLLGALEFRSVLASLQRDGHTRMRLFNTRSQSTDHLEVPQLAIHDLAGPRAHTKKGSISPRTRSRARSSGAVPDVIDPDLSRRRPLDDGVRPPVPHTIGGLLAPPLPGDGFTDTASPEREPRQSDELQLPSPTSSDVSIQIPSYEGITDSPLAMSPSTQQSSYPSFAADPPPPYPDSAGQMNVIPMRWWWPYEHLPPPHILLGTLFPTLHDWHDKSIWDKFVSLISVPSIFLLVITLPVVENEKVDDQADDDVEQSTLGHLHVASPVSMEPNAAAEHDTEWEHYRRSTRSRQTSISLSRSTSFANLDFHIAATDAESPGVQFPRYQPDLEQDTSSMIEEDQGWNRWLLMLQIFTGPSFCVLVVWANLAGDLQRPFRVLLRAQLISLVFSLMLLGVLLTTTSPDRRPKYHVICCFLGFAIAIAWISTIAGEVVGVLQALGVILNISEAILGLTIFAIGNSIGDLVADVTVARLGYPVMALSACFGGPLLNILLGIGLGGAYQTIRAADDRYDKYPDQPFQYEPYHIQVTGTLVISAAALLVTLFALLVVVPMNKWMMTRKIGWGLIGLWTASTVINLTIELAGVWRHMAWLPMDSAGKQTAFVSQSAESSR